MAKKFYLVLDTETAGDITAPMVYDLGFSIIDRKGNVFESRSYTCKEVFCNGVAMTNAFYGSKVPNYIQDIANGTRELVTFGHAVSEMIRLSDIFGVKEICAYNLAFDLRALRHTENALYNSNEFEAWANEHEFNCIWHTACQALYKKKYARFCEENGFKSEKGNLKTSAEVGYRYLMNAPEFEESHTGLEDVQIEIQLMLKVLGTKKKVNKAPNGFCWKIPQKYRSDYKG